MKNKEYKNNPKNPYFINSVKTGTMDIEVQEYFDVDEVLTDILNKRKEWKNNKLNK